MLEAVALEAAVLEAAVLEAVALEAVALETAVLEAVAPGAAVLETTVLETVALEAAAPGTLMLVEVALAPTETEVRMLAALLLAALEENPETVEEVPLLPIFVVAGGKADEPLLTVLDGNDDAEVPLLIPLKEVTSEADRLPVEVTELETLEAVAPVVMGEVLPVPVPVETPGEREVLLPTELVEALAEVDPPHHCYC